MTDNARLHKSPQSVRIRESTDQKKHHIWAVFTQCVVFYANYLDYLLDCGRMQRAIYYPSPLGHKIPCALAPLTLSRQASMKNNFSD